MQIGNNLSVQSTNFKALDKTEKTGSVKFDMPNDSVEFSKPEKTASEKTVEQKQEILQKARTRAAGWSILFGIFDTLYYGLRSDKTVAKQFDLDVDKDKKFIKNIKKQQMLCTLPSMIPYVGLVSGTACWLYNKNMDSDKIKVE